MWNKSNGVLFCSVFVFMCFFFSKGAEDLELAPLPKFQPPFELQTGPGETTTCLLNLRLVETTEIQATLIISRNSLEFD